NHCLRTIRFRLARFRAAAKNLKNFLYVSREPMRQMRSLQLQPRLTATRGSSTMSRITLTSLMLTLVLFLGNSSGNYAAQSKQKPSDTPSGTLQKMIIENGSVTMDLDLNRLNGINSTSARPVAL